MDIDLVDRLDKLEIEESSINLDLKEVRMNDKIEIENTSPLRSNPSVSDNTSFESLDESNSKISSKI